MIPLVHSRSSPKDRKLQRIVLMGAMDPAANREMARQFQKESSNPRTVLGKSASETNLVSSCRFEGSPPSPAPYLYRTGESALSGWSDGEESDARSGYVGKADGLKCRAAVRAQRPFRGQLDALSISELSAVS